jgi:hypothetical protein
VSDPTPTSASSVRYRVFVAVALLTVAGMLYAAVHLTNTKDQDPITVVQGRQDAVEHVLPANGSTEPRQAEFGIDLAPGYDGTLVVNGTEIPRDELRRVPAQNQIFFTPGKDKILDELNGPVTVKAVVWKSSVGRGQGQDQVFEWTFTAL